MRRIVRRAAPIAPPVERKDQEAIVREQESATLPSSFGHERNTRQSFQEMARALQYASPPNEPIEDNLYTRLTRSGRSPSISNSYVFSDFNVEVDQVIERRVYQIVISFSYGRQQGGQRHYSSGFSLPYDVVERIQSGGSSIEVQEVRNLFRSLLSEFRGEVGELVYNDAVPGIVSTICSTLVRVRRI